MTFPCGLNESATLSEVRSGRSDRPPGAQERPFDSAAISQAKSTTTLPYGRPGTLWKKKQSFDRADRPSP